LPGVLTRERVIAVVAGALLAAAGLGARWLWVATSVGTGYAAKVTCSLVHNSGQPAERVLRDYVHFEVSPLGPLLRVEVAERAVEASALGLVRARALYRPGLGCTLVPGASEAPLALPAEIAEPRAALPAGLPWPQGAAGPQEPPSEAVRAALARAFAEPDPRPGQLRQTTAVLVAQGGRLVAEAYARGYGPETPFLSWSMAKSVLAALVGVAVAEGRLALAEPAPVPEWRAPGDSRGAITLDQLLRMSSGLAFDERYGPTNDVSRMLFTQPDAGAFAARSRPAAPPDAAWSYSSGTSNLVARILRDLFPGDLGALVRFARERLFERAGMTSAFFEPDASGSFVGSSFAFATARDWARFGELHLRDGVWRGERVLPEGWVRYVTTPTPAAPDGRYGAHWWLNAGRPDAPERRPWPQLPPDSYAARGHSGQWVLVVPSAELVVVRLGLGQVGDPDDGVPELAAELLRALR
jgi:CubicO group peptidase (beta-lactamase class C family)